MIITNGNIIFGQHPQSQTFRLFLETVLQVLRQTMQRQFLMAYYFKSLTNLRQKKSTIHFGDALEKYFQLLQVQLVQLRVTFSCIFVQKTTIMFSFLFNLSLNTIESLVGIFW